MKETRDTKYVQLSHAVLSIRTMDECKKFLTVLLSKAEGTAVANRWSVTRLLLEKRLSQNKITKETGVAIATVSRAQRALEGDNGICQVIAKRAGEKPSGR